MARGSSSSGCALLIAIATGLWLLSLIAKGFSATAIVLERREFWVGLGGIAATCFSAGLLYWFVLRVIESGKTLRSRSHSKTILSAAHQSASQMLADSNRRGQELLAEAERFASQTISEANRRAKEIILEAEQVRNAKIAEIQEAVLLLEAREVDIRARAMCLHEIDTMTGTAFEVYVSGLLMSKGQQVESMGGSGDMGCDLVATHNGKRCAIQCKRQGKPVSRRAVSDALGAKQLHNCDLAIVITNNWFTSDARVMAEKTGCQLIDRDMLAEMVYDYQARVREFADSSDILKSTEIFPKTLDSPASIHNKRVAR